MTMTEPALCTKAPTTGFNMPSMAKETATKFKVIEKVRLHLIVNIIRFDKATK